MAEELLTRKDVPKELTWDLSLIYATEKEMNADFEEVQRLAIRLEGFEGKLDNAGTTKECLDIYRSMVQKMILVSHYTDLAVSVDYYDEYNQ